jgi:hypothetical protein
MGGPARRQGEPLLAKAGIGGEAGGDRAPAAFAMATGNPERIAPARHSARPRTGNRRPVQPLLPSFFSLERANHRRGRNPCYAACQPMSDINIEFDWYVFPLLALMFGWPGLLIGGVTGGYLWRRHRVIGTLLGALMGTALWCGGEFLQR